MTLFEQITAVLVMIFRSVLYLMFFWIACFEIYQIMIFKKRMVMLFGGLKEKKHEKVGPYLSIILILVIFIPIMVIAKSARMSMALLFVFYLIFILASTLRAVFFGIYTERVVGAEFVSEWSKVEKIFYDQDQIRIIDNKRGAIVFIMPLETIEKIRPFIEETYRKSFNKEVYGEKDEII